MEFKVNWNFRLSLLQKVYINAIPTLYILAIAPLNKKTIGMTLGLSKTLITIKDPP